MFNRVSKVQKLVRKNDIPGLIRALRGKDWLEAVQALGRERDPRAVEPLVSVLQDENENMFKRCAAAEALGKIRDPGALEPLIAALQDKNAQVRKKAAEGLGGMGEMGIPPLLTALKDKDKYVCFEAAFKLRHLGVEDPRVLAWCSVMGRHWEEAAAQGEAAIEPLIAVLYEEETHPYAAIALGKIGAPAVEPLIAALAWGNPTTVRRRAALALGYIADPGAIEALTAARREQNEGLRDDANDALLKIEIKLKKES